MALDLSNSIDKLGVWKHSAVARLLVEGSLPENMREGTGNNSPSINDPCRNLPQSPRCARQEHWQKLIQADMEALLQAPTNDSKPKLFWKCRYCPFTGASSHMLYSHFQFHQQLLSSSDAASQHIDWLAAYQHSSKTTGNHSDNNPDDISSNTHNGQIPALGEQAMLHKKDECSLHPQPSASSFLRSIVQAVMKDNSQSETRPTSSKVYEALLGKLERNQSGTKQNDIDDKRNVQTPPHSDKSNRSTDSPLFDDPPHSSSTILQNPLVKIKNEPDDFNISEDWSSTMSPKSKSSEDAIDYTCNKKSHKRKLDTLSNGNSPSYTPQDTNDTDSQSHLSETVTQCDHNRHQTNMDNEKDSGINNSRLSSTSISIPKIKHKKYSHGYMTSLKKTQDVGVQCHLLVNHQSYDPDTSREDTMELNSMQCSSSQPFEHFEGQEKYMSQKCTHCAITFEDYVLFSIHMGCHSHIDPFTCNMCGKECENKYNFYTHIMRGHHGL